MPNFDSESEKKLLSAILNNNIDELSALNQQGYPVATYMFDVGSTLHLALSRPNIKKSTVEWLVERGADLFAETQEGQFIPLRLAVANVNIRLEIVAYLIDAYGDNLTDEQLQDVLTTAEAREYPTYSYDQMIAALGVEFVDDEQVNEESLKKAELDAEIDRDPIAVVNRLLYSDPNGQTTRNIMDKFGSLTIKTAIIDEQNGSEAKEAIESLYNEKSDKFLFSTDDSIYEMVSSMLSKEQSIDQKLEEGIIKSWMDWLSLSFKDSAYLFAFSQASGYLPFYGGNDDDFPGGPAGGNSGVFFENPQALQENTYLVAILDNMTFVVADNSA